MRTIRKIEGKITGRHKTSASTDQPSAITDSNTLDVMSNLPKTFKAVVLKEAGAPWNIEDVELQLPQEGQVLIKVKACGVCHSDSGLQQGHFGPLGQFPRIPGHEIVGNVVAVGPGEKKWKEGDYVGGGWHGGHDHLCKSCNKGLFQMCENGQVNGVNRDGGYAEYALLRTEAVVRLPKDISPVQAAPLLCAGVTVFNGIRQLGIQAGGTVAVQGLGGLGHLAIQYARKLGYRTVALSSSGSKRDFAKDLGATDYVDGSKEDTAEALNKIGGADLIVVTAPNPQLMGPLINALAPRGKLLILAPVGEVPCNTVPMISKGLSVHGWPSGHALDSEEAIAVAQEQGIKVMTEEFPLSKVAEAVELMTSGKVRFRGVLTME